jgi:hypothetical protein
MYIANYDSSFISDKSFFSSLEKLTRLGVLMEKEKVSLLKKIIQPTFAVFFLLLIFSEVTPVFAQLTPARNLTGTWESGTRGMYYSLDPTDPSLRMNDVTATFSMDITQQDSQITIILYMNMISYVVDQAYWNEYGFTIPEVGGAAIRFTGTVSSTSFSTIEQDTSFSPEHLDGTFTTDIITATLTGDQFVTDTNGIVVTWTGSSTSNPTQNPTTTPSASPIATMPPTDPQDLGTIALVRGSATLKDSTEEIQLTSHSSVGAGSQVSTGDNTIVRFEYPDQDGVVVLGENTEVGWVGLESHPAPDVLVYFTTIPQDVKYTFDWGEEGMKLLEQTLVGASAEMLITGAVSPEILAGEVVIHGGIILVHYGQFYIKEHGGWSQIFQIPQGIIQGEGTEYNVAVDDNNAVIQVIEGPVIFLDPVTNNTITLMSGQQLSLPSPQQNGFSEQTLTSNTATFNSASTDQWWSAATSSSLFNLPTINPAVLAVIILAVVFAIVFPAVAISKHNKRKASQPLFASTTVNAADSKIRNKLSNNKMQSAPSSAQPAPPKGKSTLPRPIVIGIIIGLVAAILIIAFTASVLVLFPPSNNNSGQTNPQPTTTPTLQPTPTAILTPTLPPTPTPSPTPTQNIQITGINLQIQYAVSDQGYFGPVSQSISISNQPNGYLTVEAGRRFFVYFTMNAPTSGTGSDSITDVTVGTPGFAISSVQPQLPIAFSTGSSKQITITLDAPQTSYCGPIELTLYTSG